MAEFRGSTIADVFYIYSYNTAGGCGPACVADKSLNDCMPPHILKTIRCDIWEGGGNDLPPITWHWKGRPVCSDPTLRHWNGGPVCGPSITTGKPCSEQKQQVDQAAIDCQISWIDTESWVNFKMAPFGPVSWTPPSNMKWKRWAGWRWLSVRLSFLLSHPNGGLSPDWLQCPFFGVRHGENFNFISKP